MPIEYSERLEKAARALCVKRGVDPDAAPDPMCGLGKFLGPEFQEDIRPLWQKVADQLVQAADIHNAAREAGLVY